MLPRSTVAWPNAGRKRTERAASTTPTISSEASNESTLVDRWSY